MQKTVNYLEDMPDFETNVKFDDLDRFSQDPDYLEPSKPSETETKKKSAIKKSNFGNKDAATVAQTFALKSQELTKNSLAHDLEYRTKKAEERENKPDFTSGKPRSAMKQQFEWENQQRQQAKEAKAKQQPTSNYTKENLPLRPLLKKTDNVEGNVSTLKLKNENYLMVSEEPTGENCRFLMTAPTQVTMYCDANHKQSEYAGRPTVGEKPKRSAVDAIPGVPFSLNPTANAKKVEKDRRDRHEIVQGKLAAYQKKHVDKQDKLQAKKKKKEKALMTQEEAYLKFILNRQVGAPFVQKQERQNRLADKDSDDENETPFRESAKGSTFGGSSTAGKGKDSKTPAAGALATDLKNEKLNEQMKDIDQARKNIGDAEDKLKKELKDAERKLARDQAKAASEAPSQLTSASRAQQDMGQEAFLEMDFKVPNDVLGVEDYIRKLAKPRNLNQLSKKQIEYHQKVTALREGNEEWRVIRDNNLYQLDVDKPANYKDPYDYVTPHDKIIKATRTDFNNPRCKTLDRLGMGKFDSCKNIGELHLQVPNALKRFKKDLKTNDLEKINYFIRLGIVREVRAINSRVDAQRYAKMRPKSGFSEGDRGKSFDRTSHNNSMSPSKGFASVRGESPLKGLKTVKIDGGAKKTMDTTSTHAGILKSTQDDKSESKSVACRQTTFNIGGSDTKANKSSVMLDTKSMGADGEDSLTKMSIEQLQEAIRKKEGELEDKQRQLSKLKDRDKKKKDELKHEIKNLNYEIQQLTDEEYRKQPLIGKLPKSSTYYKHFINKEFTSVIENEAVKQLQKDKEDIDEIGKEIAQDKEKQRAQEVERKAHPAYEYIRKPPKFDYY